MPQETNGSLLDEPAAGPGLPPREGRRPATVIGFLSPSADAPSSEWTPLQQPAPSSPTAAGDGSGSGPDSGSGDPLDQLDDVPTSSSASSTEDGGGPLKPLGKAALKATTRKAILIGSSMAHRFGARTEGQRLVGLYLADEEDAENIGDPIASIASRHGGIAGTAISPDTNDAIQAAMGLANYFAKQVVQMQAARDVDGQLAAGATVSDLTGGA